MSFTPANQHAQNTHPCVYILGIELATRRLGWVCLANYDDIAELRHMYVNAEVNQIFYNTPSPCPKGGRHIVLSCNPGQECTKCGTPPGDTPLYEYEKEIVMNYDLPLCQFDSDQIMDLLEPAVQRPGFDLEALAALPPALRSHLLALAFRSRIQALAAQPNSQALAVPAQTVLPVSRPILVAPYDLLQVMQPYVQSLVVLQPTILAPVILPSYHAPTVPNANLSRQTHNEGTQIIESSEDVENQAEVEGDRTRHADGSQVLEETSHSADGVAEESPESEIND